MSTTLDKLIKKWVSKYIPTEFDYKEMFTFLDNDTLYGKGGNPNIEPRPESVKNLLESHPNKLFIWQDTEGTFDKEEDSFYFYLPQSDKFVKLFNKYEAGANVTISEENLISSVDTQYTAGTNVSISEENVISASGGNLNLEDVLSNGNKANNEIELTDSSMFKTTASKSGVKVESSSFNKNIDIKYNGIKYSTSGGAILLNTDSNLN